MTPRIFLYACLACLLTVPTGVIAADGAPLSFSDPTGDLTLSPLAGAFVMSASVGDQAASVDLTETTIWDDADGFHVRFTVDDLASLDSAAASPRTEGMWFLLWQTSYQDPIGAAGRTGEWMLRATYMASADPAWHFWLERPCTDGNDDDGCAGADRDIIDGLDGRYNMDTNTVEVTAPWSLMGNAQAGDGLYGFRASGQLLWPTYPLYHIDWSQQAGAECYRLTHVPSELPRIREAPDGATGSSSGYAAPADARAQDDPCASRPDRANAGTTTSQEASASDDGASASSRNDTTEARADASREGAHASTTTPAGTNAGSDESTDTPLGGLLPVLALLGAVFVFRQRPIA